MTLVVDQFKQGGEGVDVHHAYTPRLLRLRLVTNSSRSERSNLNALPIRECVMAPDAHCSRTQRGLRAKNSAASFKLNT